MSNELRAQAAAFVPAFMNKANVTTRLDDSFDEMTKDIETELAEQEVGDITIMMNNTGFASSDRKHTSELPAHMTKHAAEFWFPESRDCSCCKGFKYGCQCSSSTKSTCSCSPKK